MEENDNVNEPNENIQNVNTEETNQENANENNTTSGEVKEGEVIGNDGFSAKEKEDGKLMAILSYVGVLSLVPYLAEKDNKWVRYHAIQGVNLFIIEVIFYIIRVFIFPMIPTCCFLSSIWQSGLINSIMIYAC